MSGCIYTVEPRLLQKRPSLLIKKKVCKWKLISKNRATHWTINRSLMAQEQQHLLGIIKSNNGSAWLHSSKVTWRHSTKKKKKNSISCQVSSILQTKSLLVCYQRSWQRMEGRSDPSFTIMTTVKTCPGKVFVGQPPTLYTIVWIMCTGAGQCLHINSVIMDKSHKSQPEEESPQ